MLLWTGYGFAVVQEFMSRNLLIQNVMIVPSLLAILTFALFVCEDAKCSRSKVKVYVFKVISPDEIVIIFVV
jgi:hypothetical protein